jgi:phage protein D
VAGDPDSGQRDWRPTPDPTTLTAEAVARATADLRREIAALREILEARMDAADAERKLLLQIMDERKQQIEQRFAERDERFSERDKARQDAVSTALAAVRELSGARDEAADKAIAKFEVSVREQISQIGELSESGRRQLGTRIDALKDQFSTEFRALAKVQDREQGVTSGALGWRTERRLDTGQLVGIAGLLLALIAVAVTIIIATR